MKILIAEDDRISRNFLQKFMQTYGEVDVAVDGMEAVDLYMDSIKNNSPYDLLCLDIMMPKVDGLKVLKVIRQLERQKNVADEDHLKIIMMTALADVGYVDEAFRQGCDAYASKPVDTDKVENVIRCKNPRCITSTESYLNQIFRLVDRERSEYRCEYCDELYHAGHTEVL